MLRRVRECVLPSITRDEPIQAWIIDDTGFPKKDSHSVGVLRTPPHLARHAIFLPVGHRPRGSPAAFATPHAQLNRNLAYSPRAHFGARTATMSLLRTDASEGRRAE